MNIIKISLLITVFSQITPINVTVFTQNQGGIIGLSKKNSGLKNKLDAYFEDLVNHVKNYGSEMVIYGIQELVELKFFELVSKDYGHAFNNMFGNANEGLNTEGECTIMQKFLENYFPHFNVFYFPNYSMATFLMVKKNMVDLTKFEVLENFNQNGKFQEKQFNKGFWGQKGGTICLIEFIYKRKLFRIIHINSHLDSSSPSARQNQYQTLLNITLEKIQQNNFDYYSILFSGDFNSRLTQQEKDFLKSEHDRSTNLVKDYIKLRYTNQDFYNSEEFSQYNQFISSENIIMQEFQITFQPTYKLDFNSNLKCYLSENYENCYKKKKNNPIFAYTDRIFYYSYSQNLSIYEYNIIQSLLVSDHFTVFGVFDINSNVEDIAKDETDISDEDDGSNLDAVQDFGELTRFDDINFANIMDVLPDRDGMENIDWSEEDDVAEDDYFDVNERRVIRI